MVDEDDALAPRLDEMESRECADDFIVFIEDRVAPVAALQHDLLHVVDEIAQVERFEVVRAADARNFDCMIDHSRSAERVERRDDDAGLCGQLAQLLRQARLADDQAVDVLLDGAPRHVRLFADNDDRLRPGKQQIRI